MKREKVQSSNRELVLASLGDDMKEKLLDHFNSIYECTELGEREYKIIYLAWLWANGFVVRSESGMRTFDGGEAGVPITDYEITIESETTGGVNLELTYTYYNVDEIIKLMKWDKS